MMALCRDVTWNYYYSPQQEELWFANRVKNDSTDHFGKRETLEAARSPTNDMHRAALAPTMAMEADPTSYGII